MDTLHPRCAGLDVHKDTVVACARHAGPGGRVAEQVRTFGTTTAGLLALGDWLAEQGVTHAAMESTGVYWKPVWNLTLSAVEGLEGRLSLLLANAQHIKNVPGRKTDVKDCQWIAQLLQHGLLRPSFVPDRPQRELRDLTRQRAQLVADRARVSNRIQKVLEDANVKLGSVASDVLGASGRDMLGALVEGKMDAAAMAELARFRMRAKIPQLREALAGPFGCAQGEVTDHHRFMLRQLLAQVEGLDAQVAAFPLDSAQGARVEAVMTPLEREAVGPPGRHARRRGAVGPGDRRRGRHGHGPVPVGRPPLRLRSGPSWAGLCPGNNESAGKRRTGHVNPGNPYLRATLCQCALAAGRTKGSYHSSQYRRIAARRGGKRAVLAVAHSQLVAAYHVIGGAEHKDLGADHFDKLAPDRLKRNLVARLEHLGFKVNLEEKPAA